MMLGEMTSIQVELVEERASWPGYHGYHLIFLGAKLTLVMCDARCICDIPEARKY